MGTGRHLLILVFAAWAAALPAGIVGTGLRGPSPLLNAGGVLAFSLPFFLLSLAVAVAAYFIARRSRGNPLAIGAVVAFGVNAFMFYELMKNAG